MVRTRTIYCFPFADCCRRSSWLFRSHIGISTWCGHACCLVLVLEPRTCRTACRSGPSPARDTPCQSHLLRSRRLPREPIEKISLLLCSQEALTRQQPLDVAVEQAWLGCELAQHVHRRVHVAFGSVRRARGNPQTSRDVAELVAPFAIRVWVQALRPDERIQPVRTSPVKLEPLWSGDVCPCALTGKHGCVVRRVVRAERGRLEVGQEG